jgi:hypothetical protein
MCAGVDDVGHLVPRSGSLPDAIQETAATSITTLAIGNATAPLIGGSCALAS